jgi:hypothetical protein
VTRDKRRALAARNLRRTEATLRARGWSEATIARLLHVAAKSSPGRCDCRVCASNRRALGRRDRSPPPLEAE